MPVTIKFKPNPDFPLFHGPKYGVMHWKAGTVRDLEADDAERLMQSFPDWFEVVTGAVAKPPVDRAVKTPNKKPPQKAVVKSKAKTKPKTPTKAKTPTKRKPKAVKGKT